MRSGLLLACWIAFCAAMPAPAGAVEKLTGEQIRGAFEGNTVAGRYANGAPFSEYHHADGRATGHNRGVPNRDACWTTTNDAVCYYYGPQERRRTHCFSVELTNRLYVLRTYRDNRLNAMASVEPGDPDGHAGRSEAWTCDGLISGAPAHTRQLARR